MSRTTYAALAVACAAFALFCFGRAFALVAEARELMNQRTECCCTTDTDCMQRCGGTGEPE